MPTHSEYLAMFHSMPAALHVRLTPYYVQDMSLTCSQIVTPWLQERISLCNLLLPLPVVAAPVLFMSAVIRMVVLSKSAWCRHAS